MKKKRSEWAKVGERVELRGKGRFGVLKWCNSFNWCRVSWDDAGPRFCHLYELEPIRVNVI